MKILYVFLLCLLCGCATNDATTMSLLIQRLNKLENQDIMPRGYVPPNPYPNRLNDAQKDFVEYMLNYLADEEETD